MISGNYLDLSDLVETFDLEENRRLLKDQLDAIKSDSEHMDDNFKLLYTRYAAIKDENSTTTPETKEEVERMFRDVCEMYITMIGGAFEAEIDSEYFLDHEGNLASLALQYYLFFILDLRSNVFNVLLSYISSHKADIAAQFEELRQRHDSITEANRSLEDPDIALIASNIYEVIDWVLEQIDAETYFDNLEEGYVVTEPMRKLYDRGVIDGGFIIAIRDILHDNVSMKARVGFDIICRLKGYEL